ncbi:1-deoxy-D-xylulose 5-phosphate reductoisomerase [Meiothermus granaticius NBRC 107808]|uniref:1-deoxy-D-xylulose 5-phosphate reductoisomerase n=3 Tax=Meiothermus TaxID=65551 RepID=A0A399FEL2_9DEIN|nr:1-deoxy-D-xylulose 5-phosphate reductoisomerase [Meiothermus granaticius NBRC 107808]
MGGVAPTVLNAADEIAVKAFLGGRIGYLDIAGVLEKVLQQTPVLPLTWENILRSDAEARKRAEEWVRTRA